MLFTLMRVYSTEAATPTTLKELEVLKNNFGPSTVKHKSKHDLKND